MTISINIPDNQVNRVLDAFETEFGYQAQSEDGTPNPETRQQFTKRHIQTMIRQIVYRQEGEKAHRLVAPSPSITIT